MAMSARTLPPELAAAAALGPYPDLNMRLEGQRQRALGRIPQAVMDVVRGVAPEPNLDAWLRRKSHDLKKHVTSACARVNTQVKTAGAVSILDGSTATPTRRLEQLAVRFLLADLLAPSCAQALDAARP